MIDVDTTPRFTGPQAEAIVRGDLEVPTETGGLALLTRHRYGRWLPPEARAPGSGNHRRLSERDLATVLACARMATGEHRVGPRGGSKQHRRDDLADALSLVLHASDDWRRCAAVGVRDGRGLLVDDPAEALPLLTRPGGGRVVYLDDCVAQVRAFPL